MCFAEDTDSLPTGWLGQNELATYMGSDNKTKNYTKNDNLVFLNTTRSQQVMNFSSQSFQNLNKGVGDLARALGVEGKPGNYNILQYLLPSMIGSTANGSTMPALFMSPGIAKSLYDYGLTSKAAVVAWVNANDWVTLGDWQKMGWYDFATNGGTRTIVTSDNKTMMMKDAPISTKWQVGGVPAILVTNVGGDECIMAFGSWSGLGSVRPVDPWR